MAFSESSDIAAVDSGFLAAISAAERVRLVDTPSSLHRLSNISNDLGRELWIKRDDLVGFGFGGNKVRKLEFILRDAIESDADCVVTVGAFQSNHARATAAAAARAGLDCFLVLGPDSGRGTLSGNALLAASIFGAELHIQKTGSWDELESAAGALEAQLFVNGHRPYRIPLGGTTAVGCMGIALAYAELRSQLRATLVDTTIVVASSTGGTQAGLLWASSVLDPPGSRPSIVGVDVAKIPGLERTIRRLVGEMSERSGLPHGISRTSKAITLLDGYVGLGYSVPSRGSHETLRHVARREGVLLDPIYTSKAFQPILERDERLKGAGRLIFWHTGGQPAVFSNGYCSDPNSHAVVEGVTAAPH